MPDGHCRHCVKYPTNHAGQCRDDEGACWVLRCPACAEAERIAAAITATIPDEYPGITDQETMQLLSEVFAECADIARGEA